MRSGTSTLIAGVAVTLNLTMAVADAGTPPSPPAETSRPVRLVDYSESGEAFRFLRRGPRVFDVIVTPAFDDDVLDFAVRQATVCTEPVVLRVRGAPVDATPSRSYGQFTWEPIPHTVDDDGALVIRTVLDEAHAVIRLRPPHAPRPDGARPYYDVVRLESFLATLASDPLVAVDVLGFSYQNRPGVDRPIYRVIVNDPAFPDEDKLAVLVTARVHGNESTNSYITEGMIEYARGALPVPPPFERPDDLLERMTFVVYPMLNPDGVEAMSRGNRNGVDLNRNWDETGSGAGEEWEVRHVHGDIEAIVAGHPFAQAVDMHGWGAGFEGGYRFGLGLPPASVPGNYHENQETYFAVQEAVNPWRPAANFSSNGATIGMARYCLFTQLGIDVHTSESDEGSSRSVQSVVEEGANYVLSFYAYLLNTAFTDAGGVEVTSYAIDVDDVYVTVADEDENRNPSVIEQLTVTVTNSATTDTETVTVVETAVNSGLFRNASGVPLTAGPASSGDGVIQTAPGATLVVTYSDPNLPQSTATDRALATAAGLPGDINGDGVVDVLDLLLLLGAWGPCPSPPEPCDADLDGSGVVDVLDLLILLANWT